MLPSVMREWIITLYTFSTFILYYRSKSVSPALLGRPMSMSEDSVFSPDPSDPDQRPVTPANKEFAVSWTGLY